MARTPTTNPPPAPQLNGHDNAAELTVEVDGETGAAETEIVTGEDATASDQGIEELKAQLAAEKAAREQAERDNSNLRNERQQAQREVVDNRVLVLDATIKRQEGEKQDLMRQKIEAKEAGDYKLEAEVDDKLQQLNIDLKQTKLGKSRLEYEIENPGSQQQSRSGGDDDPLEKFIRENNTHPRAARWLRSHRDYADGSDPAKNAALVRAHNFALGHDDVEMNSEEYFELLEQKLGLRETPNDGTEEQRQQRQAPAAPVSRGNGIGGGGRGVVVDHGEGRTITDLGGGKLRISPAMAQYAIELGMTPQAYANEALALKREGKLN